MMTVLTIFITPGDNSHYLVNEGSYIIFGFIMAIIVIFNHRANLMRIYKGEENKISFKK